MKRKKLLALLMAAAMLVGVLAGCGGGGDEQTQAPSQSQSQGGDAQTAAPSDQGSSGATGSVYWMNFKPESDEVLQNVAKMYTDKTGVPVKVVTAASGTYEPTLTSEMDKSAPPTLFVVGSTNAVKTWGDYCLDLTGTPIVDELNTDAYNLYDENGKLCSIGYCYECFGIIVNPDLLEQAGHSVDEIKNFETLKAVAEDIHARAGELGFDAFTSNDMDDSSSWRYTGHMINLDYYYEERDSGAMWTECPPTISGTYMDNFRQLYDLCVENSTVARNELATGGHDAENEFKTGKAAFFVQGSWEWAAVSESVPNATMIPYYCGVEGEEKAGLNCGTQNYWAINAKASAEDQQATMDFLMWCVTDPEASRMLVDTFGVMPYKQAAVSANGFFADAEEYSNSGCYVMDWATNFQPKETVYRPPVVSALNQYNANPSDETWAQVVSAAVDGWASAYKTVYG